MVVWGDRCCLEVVVWESDNCLGVVVWGDGCLGVVVWESDNCLGVVVCGDGRCLGWSFEEMTVTCVSFALT